MEEARLKLGGMERGRKKKGFKMSKWEKNKCEVLKDREVKQAASCVSHISNIILQIQPFILKINELGKKYPNFSSIQTLER